LAIRPFPDRRTAGLVVSVTIAIATAVVFATTLNHVWATKREHERQMWAARDEHRRALQALLRQESAALTAIAAGLRQGRVFTVAANDARAAIWHDATLTTDVERHFPRYFQEREQLIARVLDHDTQVGRTRASLSEGLALVGAAEPYRGELVEALVNKCAGGPATTFTRTADTVRVFDEYRCSAALASASEGLLDTADDLADAASAMSGEAGRHAEETVLHGSCPYAPAEPH
jgi:hypothetical protein